ncbi:hypothetical protein L7D45_23235 [Brucella pseudogrignonensis]|uniref:hypothetical protein n=1 Tax=Brucella pseudogrignonensis TaxID=419475 RepID=UPI00190CD1A1|nr:hypothetical protein [Brucella pseudogrignonensis]MBK0022639.1 hypothetical protein [Ochrobactrum sp. S45]MBK0044654.1 hypothetical protein [Ochrobactrum sp. S46]UKK95959.1 hypothetical protein L7D45_23235 [Brucella pseudogrignonensis]
MAEKAVSNVASLNKEPAPEMGLAFAFLPRLEALSARKINKPATKRPLSISCSAVFKHAAVFQKARSSGLVSLQKTMLKS